MRQAAKRRKAPEGWRRVSIGFWYRPDVGSATRRKHGRKYVWFASSSGYDHVILTPSVGPFPTAHEAMHAWEKARQRRWSDS